MFFCEYCEIFKNPFPYRTPPVAASALTKICVYLKFLNVFVQFGGLQYLLNVIIIKKRDFKKLYEPARTGQEEDLGKSFQTNLIAFNDTVIVRSCDFKNNRIPPYQL